MREIKFRCYVKNDCCMLPWEHLVQAGDLPEMLLHGHEEDADYSKLMQYTGLKDSLNKEIYEGDILCDCLNERSYEVIWDDYGMFLFRPIGVDEREQHPINNYDLDEVKSNASTIVVGNIYENPELLEDNQ